MLAARALAFALCTLCACTSPREQSEAPRPTRAAQAAGRDAGQGSLWPAEVTPLDAPIARADEACLARHRSTLSTGVAEAIADLRYDRFFQDVCAAERALAERDRGPCAEIVASPLRAGCELRVAVLRGEPGACPTSSAGRDPLCLAFTTGERAYCETVPTRDRVRCRAALKNDRALCSGAADAALCEATVARFGGVVAARARGRAIPTRTVVHGARLDAAGAVELALHELERGARLTAEGCDYVLELEDGPARFSSTPAIVRLRLVVPARSPSPHAIAPERFELRVRARERILDDTLGASGTITVTRLEPSRLGALELAFDVTLRDGDERWRFTGDVRTFVRDLDDARCGTP